MARILPELTELELDKLKSQAEAKTYLACQQLDEQSIVLFSVPWISTTAYGTPRDGETDFIVFHKTKGILVIEVKGGGISFDPTTDTWISTDFYGNQHEIKNPFLQAKDSKFALKKYLKDDEEWSHLNLKPVFGHAVLLPDISSADKLLSTERRKEIVGTKSDMEQLPKWINSVFDYWAGDELQPNTKPMGKIGMDYVQRHFCKPFLVKPLLSTVLEHEEEKRIKLTIEQGRVIAALRQQKRAAISGGAGTGKTLLAFQRAKELADQGLHTLLVCYNQLLGDELIECSNEISNLDAMSFHQLCGRFVHEADKKQGLNYFNKVRDENPSEDKYDFWLPLALADSIEFVDIKYDAIVIDEAQDFCNEYWLPIDIFLDDDPEKYLLVFYDHNQQVYSRGTDFPVKGAPFELTKNCRNTDPIHELAYKYYSGVTTEPSDIEGDNVEIIGGASRKAQAKSLHSHLTDLLSKEEVTASDVCVLVPSKNPESYFTLLEDKPLPSGVKYSVKQYGLKDRVCIETVKRFKGLEANIIYFWGADEFDPAAEVELLYTSLSRAKARLYLVGDSEKCERLVQD